MPRFRWRVQQVRDLSNEHAARRMAQQWAKQTGFVTELVCVMDRDDDGVVTTAKVATFIPTVDVLTVEAKQ